MKKIIVFVVLSSLFALMVWAMLLQKTPKTNKYILVSNYALFDSAKALLPKNIEVKMLIPFGQDNHAFEPSVKDIMGVTSSLAFFYVLPGLNSAVKKQVKQSKENYFDLTSQIKWLHEEDEHEHHDAEEDEGIDPHYWLSIENQIATTKAMEAVLITLFKSEQAQISERSKLYRDSLEELDRTIERTFKECSLDTIAVTHDAFNYLTHDYHFESVTLNGLSPESQTSAKKMKEMMQTVVQKGIKTIFYEVFVSNKAAQAVANELGIAVDELHTLANISSTDYDKGETYDSLMRENLKRLSKARQCQ